MSKLTLVERDRRWNALQARMRQDGLDALILGGTDFRGQKGGLRYVSDFRPFHRFGYAVLPESGSPILVLHPVLEHSPAGPWIAECRFETDVAGALCRVIRGLPRAERVGLVAVDQVMRVCDYRALTETCPGTSFVDADLLFQEVRLHKSAEEIAGLEEAAAITDMCFQRLLEVARVGVSARAVHSEVIRTCYAAGGEEPLFLHMYGDRVGHRSVIAAPADRPVSEGEPFVFSLELIGPSGYWVEFCRLLTTGPVPEPTGELTRLCQAAVEAARQVMRPGVTGPQLQATLEARLPSHLFDVSGWSGHAIGQDVIEKPLIGRDLAADAGLSAFAAGTALALHPMIRRRDDDMLAYVADTYIMGDDGARPLSRWPLQVYRV